MSETTVQGFSGSDAPAASIYDRCVRCGLCLPSCPTYLETLTETSGPRGRISLIKDVGEGRLDLSSPGFLHQMSECLGCRACEAVCPSGVHYGQLIETARAQIVAGQRASPFERFARWLGLRVLFTHLGVMRALARTLRFAQRSGLENLASRSGLLRLLRLQNAAALAPRIPDRFFVPHDQRFESPHKRAVAFLHAGCVMHVAFTGVHEATVRVLRRNGCSVVVPRGQGCCGAIAVHAGEPDLGREMARRNIDVFERSRAEYYVVNAAGCGATLKEYGELLADDLTYADRARHFSSRVRDVSEFLDQLGIASPGALEISVTYQDACHLAHAQRVAAAPRRLLAQIPKLRLIEMNESSVCCGSAGIYNLTQPAMAERLGRRKVENAAATNADVLATANVACGLQIAAGLRSVHSAMRVRHIVEILDDAYQARP